MPDTNVFNLLSATMRRTIYDMGWTAFSPIQVAGIPAVIQGTNDLILCAETAAGKTEAAFLPILSLVEDTARSKVTVLYISPLKALINDQYERLGDLCSRTGIAVHRWHGDVSAARKQKLMRQPAGILQITPESLESLYINRTAYLPDLFSALEFVVIDELHAFMGVSRGTHLRSLLHRLTRYTRKQPRIIGLSATIGDPIVAQKWLNPNTPEAVMFIQASGSEKETLYRLFHYPDGAPGNPPLSMAEEIRNLTCDHSAIIFCNTRPQVERLAHLLNRLSRQESDTSPYLVHHASVAKDRREDIEQQLKTSRAPRSVVATSTLELGLDIGQLDLVIQVDATVSVDSLAQRLGRSGRRTGSSRIFALFTTFDEALVQAVAVTELFLAGWLEPKAQKELPYDCLWHQAISLVEEAHGMSPATLVTELSTNPAFNSLVKADIAQLIADTTAAGYLEYLPGSGELIVGLKSEKILRAQEWYGVFESSNDYAIVHNGVEIGMVTPTPSLQTPGYRFLLAGQMWEVINCDSQREQVYVKAAPDGAAPVWVAPDTTIIHQSIRSKMAAVLATNTALPYLNEAAARTLHGLRVAWQQQGLGVARRPIVYNGKRVRINAFAGTREQNTLAAMLTLATGTAFSPTGHWGAVECINYEDALPIAAALEELARTNYTTADLVALVADDQLYHTKFSAHLPIWAQRRLHESALFDIPSTLAYLAEIHWQEYQA